MSVKSSKTTCSGLEWNAMLGLISQLKKDELYQDSMLISIGCYLGMRASDILNLKWEDVVGKSTLQLKEGKTGKTRNIAINPQCQNNILFVWQRQSNKFYRRLHNHIFINKKGRKISLQYINRRLKWIFKKYKIRTDNASTHTLRKTFGKRVYEMNDKSEASLIMLSLVFSHSNTSITRRYLGITQEEIQDVYLNL